MAEKRKIQGFHGNIHISENDLTDAIVKSRPILRDREEYINLHDFLNHLRLYTERFRERYHEKTIRSLDFQKRKFRPS